MALRRACPGGSRASLDSCNARSRRNNPCDSPSSDTTLRVVNHVAERRATLLQRTPDESRPYRTPIVHFRDWYFKDYRK